MSLFPFLSEKRKWSWSRVWSMCVLKSLNIRKRIKGKNYNNGKPILIVSNHISWVDIPLMLSLARVTFLSKSEIKKWPVLGYLASKAGTVFIDRSKITEIKSVTKKITTLINQGKNILLFPEGTTSKGDAVLPFHASFLQSAIDAKCQVLPVSIRYLKSDNKPDYAPAYVEGLSFLDTLFNLAKTRQIIAEVHYHELINVSNLNRRDLAKLLHHKIQSAF